MKFDQNVGSCLFYLPFVHGVQKKTASRTVNERLKGIWSDFCSSHPDLELTQHCFNNVPPYNFRSVTNAMLILLKPTYSGEVQGCFGFNGGVPWLRDSDGPICFICKQRVDDKSHFFLDCSTFKDNFAFGGVNKKNQRLEL